MRALPNRVHSFIYRNRWHDPATALLGKHGLRFALWRARRGGRYAILIGELTGWKEIANTYGHLPGEQAVTAGLRAAEAAGAGAPVARVGWLGFAAIVPADGARELAEGICRAVAETEVVPEYPDKRMGVVIGVDPDLGSFGDPFSYAWRCLGVAIERGVPVVVWGE